MLVMVVVLLTRIVVSRCEKLCKRAGVWNTVLMRVLAIDPGFDRVGIAILERQKGKEIVLFSECLITNRTDTFLERLSMIGERVRVIISEWSPTLLAMESLLFAKNQTTALRVAEARGVVAYEAARAGLPLREFSPPQVKLATTGYGRADKKQMAHMVRIITGLGADKKLDDELDAIAVGITCLAIHTPDK